MNIFILDNDPQVAATYHTDKHVVKMILETAQLLSTAHHVYNSEIAPLVYKKTHVNHPSAVWVRANSTNYVWTYALFKSLLAEYTHRYGKHHSSEKLLHYLQFIPKGMPITTHTTPFALAMPDEFKNADPVIAYRKYYANAKRHLHAWTNRPEPFWLKEIYGTI